MACRSLLRCMQQGLVTRHVAPASVVTTNHGGKRYVGKITQKPITSKFQWYRMAGYGWKYFKALTKDVTDFELEVIQTPEQIEYEEKMVKAARTRENQAELLKGKLTPDHENVLEFLQIYKESGNWKMVNEIYLGALLEEQMYDYIDPEFLKEVEDWLLVTHPRYILYDFKY